jgi:hypothetical protein
MSISPVNNRMLLWKIPIDPVYNTRKNFTKKHFTFSVNSDIIRLTTRSVRKFITREGKTQGGKSHERNNS